MASRPLSPAAAHAAIAYGLRSENPDALQYAAQVISASLPVDAVYVAMPDRQGSTAKSLQLAQELVKASGGQALDLLTAKRPPRGTSLGLLSGDALGIRARGDLPEGLPEDVVLVDACDLPDSAHQSARAALGRPDALSASWARLGELADQAEAIRIAERMLEKMGRRVAARMWPARRVAITQPVNPEFHTKAWDEKVPVFDVGDAALKKNAKKFEDVVGNIMRVYELATPVQKYSWARWYDNAHAVAQELSAKYRLPLEVTAGVIAVMSPNLKWDLNVNAAVHVIEWWQSAERGPGTFRYNEENVAPAGPFASGSPVYDSNVDPRLVGPEGLRVRDLTGNEPDEELSDDLLDAPLPDEDETTQEVRAEAQLQQMPGSLVSDQWGKRPDYVWDEEKQKLRGGRTKTVRKEPVAVKPARANPPQGAYGPRSPQYDANMQKAIDILRTGNPYPYLGGGKKVPAFFESILNPEAAGDNVVVDGHAFNIATGKIQGVHDVGAIPDKAYDFFAEAYREAARHLNAAHPELAEPITAQHVQATTWTVWRSMLKNEDAKKRAKKKAAEQARKLKAAERAKKPRKAAAHDGEWHDQIPGGPADDLTPADFDPEALARGTVDESEEHGDPVFATEVSMDHLAMDPTYYDEDDGGDEDDRAARDAQRLSSRFDAVRQAVKRSPFGERELREWFGGDQPVTIISASQSGPISETKERHRDLLMTLQAMGIKPADIKQMRGQWEQEGTMRPGPSVAVRGLPFEAAVELARKFGQEAIIHQEPGGPPVMYEGYMEGQKPMAMVPQAGGQPLSGLDALSTKPRVPKETLRGQPSAKDLFTGTRSHTFEFGYDWGAAPVPWSGQEPLSDKDLQRLFPKEQHREPPETPPETPPEGPRSEARLAHQRLARAWAAVVGTGPDAPATAAGGPSARRSAARADARGQLIRREAAPTPVTDDNGLSGSIDSSDIRLEDRVRLRKAVALTQNGERLTATVGAIGEVIGRSGDQLVVMLPVELRRATAGGQARETRTRLQACRVSARSVEVLLSSYDDRAKGLDRYRESPW